MKKTLLYLSCLLLAVFGLYQIKMTVLAEQSGSSPESSSSSRIKTAYDWLVAKGANYGSTDAADWDTSTYSWGAWWNRIMESAAWEPDGDLTVGEVSPGKTFYSGNSDRTQKTGTGTIYSNQSLVEYDDYESGDGETEESSWSNTATNVWQDSRTGLYWSNSQGQFDNIFPDQDHSSCDFFGESDRGDYGGSDADCGNAINTCGTLSLEAVTAGGAQTDWYLPSQKEFQQAYIDGMYNQAGSTFTTTSTFWSSTEQSNNPATAWRVNLHYGNTYNNTKVTSTNYVRCVRRD